MELGLHSSARLITFSWCRATWTSFATVKNFLIYAVLVPSFCCSENIFSSNGFMLCTAFLIFTLKKRFFVERYAVMCDATEFFLLRLWIVVFDASSMFMSFHRVMRSRHLGIMQRNILYTRLTAFPLPCNIWSDAISWYLFIFKRLSFFIIQTYQYLHCTYTPHPTSSHSKIPLHTHLTCHSPISIPHRQKLPSRHFQRAPLPRGIQIKLPRAHVSWTRSVLLQLTDVTGNWIITSQST